jgi:hypothetical protein
MRTFNELNFKERENALINTTMYIITEVITGVLKIEFSDARNQEEYRKIMKEAGAHDSVRYAQYAMWHHTGIRTEIEKLSLIVCTESMYDEEGHAITKDPKEHLS